MKKINLSKYSGDTTFNELDTIRWDMRTIVRLFRSTTDNAFDRQVLYTTLEVILEKYELDEGSNDE